MIITQKLLYLVDGCWHPFYFLYLFYFLGYLFFLFIFHLILTPLYFTFSFLIPAGPFIQVVVAFRFHWPFSFIQAGPFIQVVVAFNLTGSVGCLDFQTPLGFFFVWALVSYLSLLSVVIGGPFQLGQFALWIQYIPLNSIHLLVTRLLSRLFAV